MTHETTFTIYLWGDVLEEHAPEWAKMFDRQPATAGGKK